MPDEIYTVRYVCDPTNFLAGIHRIEAAIKSLDATVTASKKNLSGFAGGGARSAANATQRINDLVAALNQVPNAAAAAGSATSTAMQGVASSAQSAKGSSNDLLATLKKFGAAGIALGVVAKGLHMIGRASENAKKHLNQAAEGGIDKREQSREYATLLGKNEVDDEAMTRLFGLGQAGGSKFDEAREFGEAFLGSVTTGRDAGHITPEQEVIVEQQGLAFGNRVGIDRETAGRLSGSVSQFTDLTKDERGNKLTTQQGVDKQMGQMNALHYGLNEGVGKVSTLARNELGAAAPSLAAGHVQDHAELGAFVGIASTIGKGAASSGNKFTQMDKLVNETQGEEGDFLKSIGVSDQKGDLEKLRVLKRYMDAQRKAAPDPSKFDAIAHLKEKGFGSHEEVSSTLGFLSNFDVLELRAKNARKRAGDGQAAIKANAQFLNSQDGQAGQAKAIEEAGNYEQGRKRQRLAAARKAAYGQLQAENKIDTFGTNITDEFMDGTINNIKPNTEHEARIDQRVLDNAREAAKKAGIEKDVRAYNDRMMPDTFDPELNIDTSYTGQDPTKIDEFLNRFGPKIEQKGVSINNGQVKVGTNAADQAAAAPAGAPGVAGAPGGNGAAAPGAPGKVASVEAPDIKEAGKVLTAAVDKFGDIVRSMGRGGSSPGSHLGGGYDPYLA